MAVLLKQRYEFRNSPAVYAHQAFPSAMPFGLFSNDRKNCFRVQMVLMNQKLIGALPLDIPMYERVFWKIFKIERNDSLCSANYGGSKNMAVLRMVGHCWDQCCVTLHPGIREVNLQLMKQMRRLCRSQP
jgi:hypothetical protein